MLMFKVKQHGEVVTRGIFLRSELCWTSLNSMIYMRKLTTKSGTFLMDG